MSRRQRRTRQKQARHAPRRVGATGGLALAASLLTGATAQAAGTFYVESYYDTAGTQTSCDLGVDYCTLRDALRVAEADGGGTILFASNLSGQTITLKSDLPTFATGSLDIDGANAPGLKVDGYYYDGATPNFSRIFSLNTPGDVAISHLELENARGGVGAAVDSEGTGTLALSSMNIHNSQGSDGTGGAVHSHGPLTITASAFTSNSNPSGGAVGADSTLTIYGSTLSGNSAYRYGGAVDATGDGDVTIGNTTFYGNFTNAYDADSGGGAIFIEDALGPVAITGSTITGNYSNSYNQHAYGGGVFVGGGSDVSTAQIHDTVVSGNLTTTYNGTVGDPDIHGYFTTAFSLIGNRGGAYAPVSSTDLPDGTDPYLHSFSNGTLKPFDTSPLVDAGYSFGLTIDQRLKDRPYDAPAANGPDPGDGADIGAVELQAAEFPAPPPPPSGGSSSAGAPAAVPVVTALSPNSGPAGTSVVISGHNLGHATEVRFGSTPATFSVNSDNQVTAVAPSGLAGTGDVIVVDEHGSSTPSAADKFTYVTAGAPAGPPPATPGTFTSTRNRVKFGRHRHRTLRSLELHGIVVHITCDPGPCDVRAKLRQGGVPVGSKTATLEKINNHAVRVRLSRVGLEWLSEHPAGRDTGHLRLNVIINGHLESARYTFTR